MDNTKQIEEIKRYQERLHKITGIAIPVEAAAQIWIRKYAEAWRLRQTRETRN